MPLSPGVYVQEVSGGAKPIAGVGTANGAFVGLATQGITNKAFLVTNWTQFVNEFGSFNKDYYLAYAVYGFFAEGGTSCYVVRVTLANAQPATATIKSGTTDVLTIAASSAGSWGNTLQVEITDPSNPPEDAENAAALFDVIVRESGQFVEKIANVSMTTVETLAPGGTETTVKATIVEEATARPDNGTYNLSTGSNGTDNADFVGTEANKKGLHAFDEVDNINIVAIPDQPGDRSVILDGLNYCRNRKDCFFIADPPFGETPTGITDFKKGTGTIYQGNAFNSSYGAIYYPWVMITDQLSGKKRAIPPSGVAAGTYAYTDSARGVHKAPAGVSDGYLDSVVGIERIVTIGEHDQLNPEGINVIRSFPGTGICIWGARTLSADTEWQYINIRRLFMFIEESLYKGTQWVVFEPNDPALWGTVKRNITAFLMRVWRDGALFGKTADEAFFVKVDAENNPPEVRDAGELIIEVGVAPVKPAEFVIIKISQKTLAK
jgi:phage tail sheath protein FI